MRKRTFFSKNIAVFVAGSIKLKSERDALKAMVLDLNSKSRIQRLGTHVDIKSYEDDFKNKQEEYNKFVQKTADLVFVLITDSIGDNTELELKTASESLCENGWPEVYVFIKDDNTLKDDDPRVMKMREYLGQDSYAIRFKDSDELKIEARKRIMQHVGVLYRFSRNVKKWILRVLLFSLLLLVGFLVFSKCQKNRPIIMFAGGGSAAQFIKQNYHQDVLTIPNSVYARMPSSYAWTLLAEEILSPSGKGFDGADRKFYPICLSAEEAPDSFFIKQVVDDTKFGRRAVVSYYLGEDDLILYVESEYAKKRGWKDNKLEVDSLLELLRHNTDSVKIYCTSIGSGTMDTYQKVLSFRQRNVKSGKIYLDTLMRGNKINKFTEYNRFTPDKDGYVVLGSKYYSVPSNESIKCDTLTLTLNNQIVSKGIYLYFNCYNDTESDNMQIPKEVVDVLVDYFHIDRDTSIKKGTLQKSENGGYCITTYDKNVSKVFAYLNKRDETLNKFWENIDDSLKIKPFNEKIEEDESAPKQKPIK